MNDDDNLIAIDLRSVTISGSSALVSIPGAPDTITDGGQRDDDPICRIKVIDDGDQIRFEGSIDKPDSDDDTND